MSTIVAIVKSLVGQVFAVSLDGLKRQIFEGERVLQGEQVLTGLGGEVTLQLANGEVLSVAQNSNWQAGQAEPADSAQAPASELEQAIAAGLDPTTELEATAAGAGTGGGTGGAAGGGHSFVMLDETGGQLEAEIGFETSGLGLGGSVQDEIDGLTEETGDTDLVDTTTPTIPVDPIDPVDPVDPVVPTAPTLNLLVDSGVADDLITNDGSYSIGGVEPGATVEYSTDGTTWSTTPPVAVEGSNTILVRQTDVAGNTSPSSSLTFTLDTTANITVSLDDVNSANVANAPISGTSDVGPGRTVTLTITDANGNTVTTTAITGTDGSYSTTADLSGLADGNLVVTASVTDAAGNSWTYDYDPRGNCIRETDPLGHATHYRYDSQGRMVEITDASAKTKRLQWNDLGQLLRFTDCSGYPTHFSYDRRGYLQAITDAGFVVPPELLQLPGSNVARNKHYDQIAYFRNLSKMRTTGRAGIFDFYEHVYRDEGAYAGPRNGRGSSFNEWRTYQMSDHLPMWIEFSVDDSEAYLDGL